MGKLLKTGIVTVIIGTIIVVFGSALDYGYHMVTEPEEVLPDDMPVELIDHVIIMGGFVMVIIGGVIMTVLGIIAALRK